MFLKAPRFFGCFDKPRGLGISPKAALESRLLIQSEEARENGTLGDCAPKIVANYRSQVETHLRLAGLIAETSGGGSWRVDLLNAVYNRKLREGRQVKLMGLTASVTETDDFHCANGVCACARPVWVILR